MNKFIGYFFFIMTAITAGLIGGCAREDAAAPVPPADLPTEAGLHLGAQSALLRDLKPTDVIVWLNREPVTKADYLRRVSLAERLYRLQNKLPLTGDDKIVGKKFKRNNAYFITELIGEGLIRQESARLGVKADDGDLKTIRKNFAKTILKGKYKFDQLLAKLPTADASALRDKIELQACAQGLIKVSATNGLDQVSEADLDSALQQIADFNARAAKENEKSRKRALKAKAEILAGAPFAEVTKRVAQVHPEYGAKWEDDLQLGEFESDDPIRQWLEKAAVGDISDPIDLDDGLAIIGLVAKTPIEVPGAKTGDPVVYSYTAVRCTFKAFEETAERTREQLRAEIAADRRKAAAQDLMTRLKGAAVIYLPYGDDLFPVKKPKPQAPLPKALQEVMSDEEKEKANEVH